MKNGISVIVCCFNSVGRLEPTLNHLSKQSFTSEYDWELILVDNACTDNTVAFAKSVWKSYNTDIRLRVVYEKKPGLGNARRTGIEHSLYKYILFCDDDNWLSTDYLVRSHSIMESNPEIAAVGGRGIPVFEDGLEPDWFGEYQEAFAVGAQSSAGEQKNLLCLYGAGLLLRKSHLAKIFEYGFEPLLQDRVGKNLSSSGDTELTNVLVLAGFRLFYSPDLHFRHYLPKSRLTKEYLTQLFKAFGKDGPIRNLYYSFITDRTSHQLLKYWWVHFALALFRLAKYTLKPPKKNGRKIYFHWNIAYMMSLLMLYPKYTGIWLKIAILERRLTNQFENNDQSIFTIISESPTIQ